MLEALKNNVTTAVAEAMGRYQRDEAPSRRSRSQSATAKGLADQQRPTERNSPTAQANKDKAGTQRPATHGGGTVANQTEKKKSAAEAALLATIEELHGAI